MSYWSENPEIYDEICCQGVSRFLVGRSEGPVYEALLEWALDPDLRPAFRKLCRLATRDIRSAEQSYWSE